MGKLKMLKSKRASFTLVEVLVAMAILMILIGAMVGIEASSIRLASSGKHQLQAIGLARGALNLVRTIRDTNILKENPPFLGLDPTAGSKYLNETGNIWSLSDVVTPAPTYKTQTLDGTVYTIKIEISK